MNKLLSVFLLILFLSISLPVLAQGDISIGVGANVAVSTGDFADWTGVGFGGTASFMLGLTPTYALSAQIGYLSFASKERGAGIKTSAAGIPILAGLRYRFGIPGSPRFILGVMGGIHQIDFKSKGTQLLPSSNKTTKLVLVPEIGVITRNIDLTANYTVIFTSGTTTNYFGVRLGYNFQLGIK